MKYFKFGNFGYTVNIDYDIDTGNYLDKFECGKTDDGDEQIHVDFRLEDQKLTGEKIACGEYLLDHDLGVERVIIPHGFVKNAVSFQPTDWKSNTIEITVNPAILNLKGFNLNQLLGFAGIQESFIFRRAIVIHASYIVVNGEAILFTAPSGTGKSTQAALWEKYGNAEIVNGDRALIFYNQSERRFYAGGFSICGSSDICNNISAPLKAIVILRQNGENQMLPMRKIEVYGNLLSASSFFHWNKEENILAGETVTSIMESVPVMKYGCKPDPSAVEYLQRYLDEL